MERNQKQKNKNIAMFCLHSHPLGDLGTKETGGMSVYIYQLAMELGKSGYFVDIFTPFNGIYHKKTMTLGKNARLIHINARKKHPLNQQNIYTHIDKFISGVERFRLRSGLTYDLIHSHYWLSGMAGIQAQKKWSTPHVITFHTISAIQKKVTQDSNISDFRLCCEKELISSCDLVVSHTEFEKQDIIQIFRCPPSKISVIGCGVDLSTFSPVDKNKAREALGVSHREILLLYVGRIDPMKRVDRLLSAAALLKQEQSCKLFIIGGDHTPGQEQRKLHAMAKKLNIENSLVFPGSLPQQHLPLYYSAADVFVFPSRYESYGLAGLESLACGTPVVATRVGVFPQILTDKVNGRLLAGSDPKLIVKAIKEVLHQSWETKNLAEKIRSCVNRYTWDRTARAISAEYESLMRPEKNGTQISSAINKKMCVDQ